MEVSKWSNQQKEEVEWAKDVPSSSHALVQTKEWGWQLDSVGDQNHSCCGTATWTEPQTIVSNNKSTRGGTLI